MLFLQRCLAGILLVAGLAVRADGATLVFNGSIQQYTITTTGMYQVVVTGAQGGRSGGLGASVQGDIFFVAGSVLDVVVGGEGVTFFNFGAGGGGGSFIYTDEIGVLTLYAAAGGGGGSSFNTVGDPGLILTSGGNGGATGGTGGNGGGATGVGSGGGGAGWLTAGTDGSGVNTGKGGATSPTFAGGAAAGGAGGFGGGGGGGGRGGGGGGGYSGGGGGAFNGAGEQGGGGGSFLGLEFSNVVLQSGVHSGNGSVQITLLQETDQPIPEPGSALLMGVGLAAVCMAVSRKVKGVR